MEDYEYLKLLADAGDEAFAQRIAGALFPNAYATEVAPALMAAREEARAADRRARRERADARRRPRLCQGRRSRQASPSRWCAAAARLAAARARRHRGAPRRAPGPPAPRALIAHAAITVREPRKAPSSAAGAPRGRAAPRRPRHVASNIELSGAVVLGRRGRRLDTARPSALSSRTTLTHPEGRINGHGLHPSEEPAVLAHPKKKIRREDALAYHSSGRKGRSRSSRRSPWRPRAISRSPTAPASPSPASRSRRTRTSRTSTRRAATSSRSSRTAPPCSASATSARPRASPSWRARASSSSGSPTSTCSTSRSTRRTSTPSARS